MATPTTEPTTGPRQPPTTIRWLNVVLAVTIGVAFLGFIQGVGTGAGTIVRTGATYSQPARDTSAEPAYSYGELLYNRRGPNRSWSTDLATVLTQPASRAPAAASLVKRPSATANRAKHRAFAGAPPTVPHPIETRGTAACIDCHSRGLQIADVRAPAMSHVVYVSCNQCHVEQTNARFDATDWASAGTNSFAGLASTGKGPRLYDGSPPVVPHTTLMRERCISCHGPRGEDGLRTSHPERHNCNQCHTPSATLDQR